MSLAEYYTSLGHTKETRKQEILCILITKYEEGSLDDKVMEAMKNPKLSQLDFTITPGMIMCVLNCIQDYFISKGLECMCATVGDNLHSVISLSWNHL